MVDGQNIYTDGNYNLSSSTSKNKRDSNNSNKMACLQRKMIINDEGKQEDLIKCKVFLWNRLQLHQKNKNTINNTNNKICFIKKFFY